MNKSVVAFIPARSGSSRIPDKNIKDFCGHPLIAYTINQAIQSKIFSSVIVSSDSKEYLDIAQKYGAQVIRRPFPISDNLSTDFEWVSHTLDHLKKYYELPDCFCILRPTSPFRQPETIRRAWKQFLDNQPCDSIRAIEKCKQHPYKMWTLRPDENDREYMIPLLNDIPEAYNSPYQVLPIVYVQNAGLEIAWVKNVYDYNNVSGKLIKPFYMPEYEGIDLNLPSDWILAEEFYFRGLAKLVEVK